LTKYFTSIHTKTEEHLLNTKWWEASVPQRETSPTPHSLTHHVDKMLHDYTYKTKEHLVQQSGGGQAFLHVKRPSPLAH